jgi:tetratricopeptide (TPR) repeat protein
MRRHTRMPDRPFCFVLGSGASKQSGIPTGAELVARWLRELHEMEDDTGRRLEEWATAENLGIEGFCYEKAERFYPPIYQRRFSDYKEEGYAFLENALDGREPSFGYSVLAQVLATTHHKVAITTNFDNLIADALATYMRTYPFVCGHESLTGYIRQDLRRPLIAKIHRDLLLQPKSNPDEIAKLPDQWTLALTRIFARFTPIVLGYGGNDGSLMSFLESLTPIEGGIFWCHRDVNQPDERVCNVVSRHPGGGLVPITGFDELMLQLQEQLKLPFLLPEMERREKQRVDDYQKQFERLTASIRAPGKTPADEKAKEAVREAAQAAVQRITKEKDWWSWQLKAYEEFDPKRREAVFREALKDFPDSVELMANFAEFLHTNAQKYDEAEMLYRKVAEIIPGNAVVLSNLAEFMCYVRKNHDEAERLYRKAFEADPTFVLNIGNFAFFLESIRKNDDEAERFYRIAINLGVNKKVLKRFEDFLKRRGKKTTPSLLTQLLRRPPSEEE